MTDLPCRGKTDLFYSETRRKIAAAKQLCVECPEQLACLERGRLQVFGVWGGVAPEDRGIRPGRSNKQAFTPGRTTDLVLEHIRKYPDSDHTPGAVHRHFPEVSRGSICKALNRLTEDMFVTRTATGPQRASYRLREKVST